MKELHYNTKTDEYLTPKTNAVFSMIANQTGVREAQKNGSNDFEIDYSRFVPEGSELSNILDYLQEIQEFMNLFEANRNKA